MLACVHGHVWSSTYNFTNIVCYMSSLHLLIYMLVCMGGYTACVYGGAQHVLYGGYITCVYGGTQHVCMGTSQHVCMGTSQHVCMQVYTACVYGDAQNVCMGVYTACVYGDIHSMAHSCKSEDHLWELFISFYHMRFGDGIHVVRSGLMLGTFTC